MFISQQLDICHFEVKKLPISQLALENAMFIKEEDNVLAWPLLCDPTLRVVEWIKSYLKEKNIVVVRYSVR